MALKESVFQALVAEIGRRKLDAMLIAPSEDFLYLTGCSPIFCERFQGLFVTASGARFYVCNLLSADEIAAALPDTPVYSWKDGEGHVETVRKALADFGLTNARIGVNSSVRAYNILEISEAVPVTWVSARYLCQEIRIYKSDAEIEGMRGAARIAEEALRDILPEIRPGMTEGDVKGRLLQRMLDRGGKAPRALVASGPNAGYPHYNGTGRVLQAGDAVLIDYSCEYQLVRTDITRTLFLGEPSPRQREIYDLVRRANEAAEQAAVDGAYIPDVEMAARKVIEDGGFGPFFTHRLGHGIGYLGHEAPDIRLDHRRHLEKRMSFTIEPGIYIPGELGVRIEDCVLIAPDGSTEVLHRFTKDYVVLQA